MRVKIHDVLIKTLEARFKKNMGRHTGLEWAEVQAKLEARPEILRALNEMERTGGESYYAARGFRGRLRV